MLSAMRSLMRTLPPEPCRRTSSDLVLGDRRITELVAGQLVAPVAEGPFGVLHDVPLCTRVTERALVLEAYWMARRTSRLVPKALMGLMRDRYPRGSRPSSHS